MTPGGNDPDRDDAAQVHSILGSRPDDRDRAGGQVTANDQTSVPDPSITA